MKLILPLLTLCFLSSCSSAIPTKEKLRLAERIEAEEARSIQEIRAHTEMLLADHPELEAATKDELKVSLNSAMTIHQDLKDKESKIFQLLLQKSLRISELSAQELKDKDNLKKALADVYEEKSKNVHSLVNKMVELSKRNQISETFKNDMLMFMRDFR